MVSFHLVKITILLFTGSVLAKDDLAALTKKVTINKKKIKKDVKTISLLTTAMDEMQASHGDHVILMTKAMDEMKASYDKQIETLSSFLDVTARSCCDSSAPTSIPSKSPTDIPTKTPSYVPSSAPTKSSRPTPNCADTYAEEISGVSDSIFSVAMYGTNHMLVGNEDDDLVELFMREYYFSNWSSVKVYKPSTPVEYGTKYGIAVALNDQHVVITSEATSYSSDTGRLIIWDRATDTETNIENPGTGKGGDSFGCSVAVSGNIIVVGAKYDDTVGSNAGIVYIYEKKDGTWDLVQLVKAPDGRRYDEFGYSVAYDGDTIVVGAVVAGPNKSGAVYLYRKGIGSTDYEYFSRIVPDNGSLNDHFGHSVATSGGVITVGSPFTGNPSYNAGTVFFYFYNPTNDSIELLESRTGTDSNHNYGRVVAMEGNRIAVTEYGVGVDVFEFSGGFNPLPPRAFSDGYEVTQIGTMTGSRSYFGKFMAISGNTIIATGSPSYYDEKLYQQTLCGDL